MQFDGLTLDFGKSLHEFLVEGDFTLGVNSSDKIEIQFTEKVEGFLLPVNNTRIELELKNPNENEENFRYTCSDMCVIPEEQKVILTVTGTFV